MWLSIPLQQYALYTYISRQAQCIGITSVFIDILSERCENPYHIKTALHTYMYDNVRFIVRVVQLFEVQVLLQPIFHDL